MLEGNLLFVELFVLDFFEAGHELKVENVLDTRCDYETGWK